MELLDVSRRVVHEDQKDKIIAYQISGSPIYIKYSNDSDKKDFVRNVGLDHICIGVDSREKVDEVYELLKNLDVVITREPRLYPEYTENYYAIYFRDPDGIPFEVAFI